MDWKRLLRGSLAGAALVCLGPALAAETETDRQQADALVIHAGTVIAVPGSEALTDQTIVVSDGRIAAVREGFLDPSAAAGGASASVELLDLRDAVVLPGPRIITAGHHIRLGADEGPGACWSVESCRRATRVQIDMGADLIAVDGDPLADVSVLMNVQVVIQGGRVVKDAR